MEKGLISVIIPIYNLSEYLSKSIESVLAQTYKNFEIIAVDDGSIDNSGELLKEYAKRDGRVKPISKKNGGVSSARNLGIEKSAGEYIFFLDGDDWLEPNALEKLCESAYKFDIIQAAYVNIYEDGLQESPKDVYFVNEEISNNEQMLSYYFLAKIQESSWNKLYKRTAIGDIRFNEGLCVGEDSTFVYNVLKRTKSVKLIKDITYYYYIREGSCMHEVIGDKHFSIMQLRDKQFVDANKTKELFEGFIFRYAKDIFYLIHGILEVEKSKYENRLPELRKRILKEKRFILTSKHLNSRFKIGVLILWFAPRLFYKLYSK